MVLARRSIGAKIWEERNWSFAAILGILTVSCEAIWYVGGLNLDKHIQLVVIIANVPLQGDVHGIDGDVQQIKGIVSVLDKLPLKNILPFQRKVCEVI